MGAHAAPERYLGPRMGEDSSGRGVVQLSNVRTSGERPSRGYRFEVGKRRRFTSVQSESNRVERAEAVLAVGGSWPFCGKRIRHLLGTDQGQARNRAFLNPLHSRPQGLSSGAEKVVTGVRDLDTRGDGLGSGEVSRKDAKGARKGE